MKAVLERWEKAVANMMMMLISCVSIYGGDANESINAMSVRGYYLVVGVGGSKLSKIFGLVEVPILPSNFGY